MITRPEPAPLIGESPQIRRARELIARYAPTQLPILIVGATGTGKELVARHVHYGSGRGALVDVDCGALPATLLEASLFGHAPRAFTGAREGRAGLIETAAGGTLFLDEIASLPLEAQRVLLRVLETRQVRRVGETVQRAVDFRLVAAVQEGIGKQMEGGAFRRDLYQRLAGVVIELPRLVERFEDLPAIAEHYAHLQGRTLEPASTRVLRMHPWPGNVRELCQVLDRAGQLAENGTLPPEAIAEAIELGAPSGGVEAMRAAARRQAADELVSALATHDWHAGQLAVALGVSRATLFRRLREAGVSLRDRRGVSRSHDVS